MTKHYLNSKYQSEQRSSAMKKITMGTASIILGSLVYIGADSQQVNAATEATNATNNQSTQVSQATSQPINFQVQKDGSSEKSHMDDYMQHPGKVIKQNNKYYFPNRVKQCIILERIQILQCKQSRISNNCC